MLLVPMGLEKVGQSAGFIIDQTAAGYSPLIINANGTEKARFNNGW